MIIKFLLRVCLVTAVFMLLLPFVVGVRFHGDLASALITSLIFNLIFFGLEWLLSIIVFGINITTLGLGVFITNALRFIAGLLIPATALFATSIVMPNFLHIAKFYPNAIVAGFVIGGVLWASLPDNDKKK